jgi:hypothetical protein
MPFHSRKPHEPCGAVVRHHGQRKYVGRELAVLVVSGELVSGSHSLFIAEITGNIWYGQ